ncbi:MAG: electron transporter [Chloroflexota bacterium]|nr:cytochrome C biogenesis protein [Chloroflexota bacterium]NOG65468.1 cytochrome C biogenesis protein [Chloroflexota bacterium]GIK64384.1 MAG: electron transporter [Chloroflexota bacterium]
MIARNVTAISILGIIALGAIALAGFWHPNMAMSSMEYLPEITLPTVITAGLLDGINPCAFTVLLLFITALTSTIKAEEASVKTLRLRLMSMGSIYIGAIFLTYLALGVGLLKSMSFFTEQHAPARIGALVAVLLGLWMLKDYFVPELGWNLHAPSWIGVRARRMGKQATIPALVVGGFLIGLCTVPCSGAVYLAVLSLLALQSSALLGYAYLVLYNVVFIMPLIVILAVASSRPSLNRLAHWNFHHKEWVRLVLGSGVVLMGLLILATV